MPAPEIVLRFPGPDHVSVSYNGTDSGLLPFANPITERDRRDITWYIETYPPRSLGEADDEEARRIEARLIAIGKSLFNAVFQDRAAQRIFDRLQDNDVEHRVLTIDSQNAEILSLPWELLHDPKGFFLFRENPHISVRRSISGATGGRAPFSVRPKDSLHLLFVVSRPKDASFLDPRADPRAVLDALDTHAPGRVTWEFLRPPATLDALAGRLKNDTLPPVDIVHFDGHGVFAELTESDVNRDRHRFGPSTQSEIQRERIAHSKDDKEARAGVGFLVFEKPDGSSHLISAHDLAENLLRARISLVVLSACQTAAMSTKGDPMASVAGRLTSTGIPAILAMTHSVLVMTTREFFGRFYRSLGEGKGIAAAVDDARAWLANYPEKFEVRRGRSRKMLTLIDWFLPSLFHAGGDLPLLTRTDQTTIRTAPQIGAHNLRPRHEAGFFGRPHELWNIERWFAGETRRLTITGFGGQGKTELALEAGRWLMRTGMFHRAVFVGYANIQSDAVGVTVSTIGNVIGRSLLDAAEANSALSELPTLVILDNIESIAPASRAELLSVAALWTEKSSTRLLITSRDPDQNHTAYRTTGTHQHRRIVLTGLGSTSSPEAALSWYTALSNLLGTGDEPAIPPPSRDALVQLFDLIDFHPLSIAVLAPQLLHYTAGDISRELGLLLSDQAISPIADEDTPRSLIASLHLSLSRLSSEQRQQVRRLGVFQGGALESELLAVLGLRYELEAGENQASLFELKRAWSDLRHQLESASLIQVETIHASLPAFVQFHPTLAPMLWADLSAEDRADLALLHRQRYYHLIGSLYNFDSRQPNIARAIAEREMPNLLRAVNETLDAGDEVGPDFVDSVCRFLGISGRIADAAALIDRSQNQSWPVGSHSWNLAQFRRGEHLLESGRVEEARACFEAVALLDDTPSYQRSVALCGVGRCLASAGYSAQAEEKMLQAIEISLQLDLSDSIVKRNLSSQLTDLADVLVDRREFEKAEDLYCRSFQMDVELGDVRGQGVVATQLGALALKRGLLDEAAKRYEESLVLARSLGEPKLVAAALHQLGTVFVHRRKIDLAEMHYREAASLSESIGDQASAAQSWAALATVLELVGKPAAAQAWYRKSIDTQGDNPRLQAVQLTNLADLLSNQPERLAESRELALKALAMKQSLDPGASQIWETYDVLAKIADRQSLPEEAAEYRRQSRESRRLFPGTSQEVQRFHLAQDMVIRAVHGDEEALEQAKAIILMLGQSGGDFPEFANSLQGILAGERDRFLLTEKLPGRLSPIVDSILLELGGVNQDK